MKKSLLFPVSLLFLSASLTALMIPRLYQIREQRQVESISELGQLPAEAIGAISFEFKGMVADFLMLKLTTFTGKKLIARQQFAPHDWLMIRDLLEKITEIDRLFWDPYVVAESMLAWEAGMVKEANSLLQKAAEFRKNDYRPYYFLGFNSFFFQKDFVNAAKYIGLAAKRTGAPFYLSGLAARLSLYGNETDVGIVFLEAMLAETTDPKIRGYLEKRLQALKAIFTLEKKVAEYRQTYGSLPSGLADLVAKGLLQEIPSDPYGGNFVLLPNGRIYTTSELVTKEKAKDSKPPNR